MKYGCIFLSHAAREEKKEKVMIKELMRLYSEIKKVEALLIAEGDREFLRWYLEDLKVLVVEIEAELAGQGEE
jgi:hypothetical protein